MAIPFSYQTISAQSVIVGTDVLVPATYYANNVSVSNPSIYVAFELDDDTIVTFNASSGEQVTIPAGTVLYPLALSTDKSTASPIPAT